MAAKTKLNVPLVRQAKGSGDCGPACVSMVLKYYNVKNNMNDVGKFIRSINKDINSSRYPSLKSGYTYSPQLGLYFLKKGYEVELVTFNPWIFNYSDKQKPNLNKRLEEMYERVKRKKVKEELKVGLRFFIEFLNNGGKLAVKVPDKTDIEDELKNGRPIIALATTNFLYKKQKKQIFNSHFNVITGLDGKYVYVNDPLAGKNGGKNKYLLSEFLFGIYASASGAPDNACLLKIKNSK